MVVVMNKLSEIYCTYIDKKVPINFCEKCDKLYECDNMWCDNHKCKNCEFKDNYDCEGVY